MESYSLLGQNFFYQNQYVVARNRKPGANPSADTAEVVLNGDYKPRIVYEYKPDVYPTVDGIDLVALAEIPLQATYVLRYHRVTSLFQCLTDFETWHYFKFCASRTGMSIDWCHKVIHN